MLQNNLIRIVSQNRLCTGVRIKVVCRVETISLAKAAGYDTVFIDLEYSVFSEKDASRLSSAALAAGVTPFVCVPYKCGQGYVQRVLDGEAFGIVSPHISTVEEAKQVVAYTDFSPMTSDP
ncbi:uncharacterized protein Z519_08698 [Cladophialophora bantiana CBS 173.52]|uniref:HpcH/HpaI aldolase/citrate lyase domain-containing protein n=1 Tax=Cladophialophora bantiana (strain ATCC 10958 / CBS 173.52 / CDC B-1940 / NIH 8579) TaxID=1442370 RepID=A0A0D2HJI3_CLAB1|nr:uncharacterized protein Z519_08698 [Cladophialophora bantiana CBS 173.52]KIW90915.1 hypothetical protein Z519_08698 [Cladophialophora bantiana CBS 173.52]